MRHLTSLVIIVFVCTCLFGVNAAIGENNYSYVVPDISKVNVSDFRYALTEMCDFLATGFPDGKWKYSEGTKETIGDYLITTADNVRIISNLKDQNINKVSVKMESYNNSAALKQIAMIAVIEERLYDKNYISNSDKHKALQHAQDMMDAILNIDTDDIDLLFEGDLDHSIILVASGKEVNYYWELIDFDLFITVFFTELPDDIY